MTTNNTKLSVKGSMQKYAMSIGRGTYDVPEEDLEKILLKMQQGQVLSYDEWIDLANAFFVKIYNTLPERFEDAVRIKRSEKIRHSVNPAKDQAIALIKLYKRQY